MSWKSLRWSHRHITVSPNTDISSRLSASPKEDRARNSSPCLKDQLDHQPEISLRYCDDEACDDAVATGRYKVLQDDLRLDTDSSYEEEVTERTTEVIRKKRGKKM